jgi:hypothetical protein
MWSIVNVFLWSILTNRTFHIHHKSPRLLTEIFEPNLVDWSGKVPTAPREVTLELLDKTLDEDDMRTMPLGEVFAKRASKQRHETGGAISEFDVINIHGANMPSMGTLKHNPLYDFGVFEVEINAGCRKIVRPQTRYESTNLLNKKWGQMSYFRPDFLKPLLWHALFKPTVSLQREAEPSLRKFERAGLVIGLHFRAGSGVGERERQNINNDVQMKWFWDCARNVSGGAHNTLWFIATDSLSVRNTAVVEARKSGAEGISQGHTKFVHTDKHPVSKKEWLETASDWYLLSKADVVVATPSSFSVTAAMFGGKYALLFGDKCSPRTRGGGAPNATTADWRGQNRTELGVPKADLGWWKTVNCAVKKIGTGSC